jgi:iron complex outermembrane recepter protein
MKQGTCGLPMLALPSETADTTRVRDIGYFAFDRLRVTDRLDLVGGVRYSDYNGSDVTQRVQTSRATPLSYSYAFVIKPWAWARLYGTFIQGLETTPLAPQSVVNAGQQLPATQSTQREAGIKVEPAQGLLVQAAYFAINRASTYINTDDYYVQDGRAVYQGEELGVSGEITPDLSIYASGLFLTAQQDRGAPTVVAANGTITPTSNGRRIENTPARQFSVAAEYRLTHLLPGAAVNVATYYTGNRAINSLNSAFVGGYTLFDAGASYTRTVGGHQVVLRANGQNIAGKRYWASTGGLFLAEGLPGEVRFSLAWRY